MTDQSPREIEREIETERQELADTLDRLQDSVSPDALVDKAEERLKADGGAMLRMLADRVAAQPVAAAVTAAGLAWLIFGGDGAQRVDGARSRLAGGRPLRPGGARGVTAHDRDRKRATQWLMSHDPDPEASLRKARAGVSPRVARMIDRLDHGTGDLPPAPQARVRRARLRAISARMASERAAMR